ncbi:hypothetical protein V6N13_127641 [Hibiscus sabdariffa]
MGKKQHIKDRMFITKTEWATECCTCTPFKRLPFYCCALTFTPSELPVCTKDGNFFDLMLSLHVYFTIHASRILNCALLDVGEYHCPVLNKVFTQYTRIVAMKTTKNVLCYEAIKELNIKTKNWKELLTDESFTKEDIITIQNPNAIDSKVTLDFYHVKNSLKVEDEVILVTLLTVVTELRKMSSDPTYNLYVAGDIKHMLAEIGTDKAKQTALLGGGGSKAQNERADALAAILAVRSRIKEDSK